jgi:hypothetical protein
MNIKEVVLKHKLRLNKEDSFDFDNIPDSKIIEACNKAQLQVINRLYSPKTIYKEGFEQTIKRLDQLQKLVTDPTPIVMVRKDRYYESDLPNNYFDYVRIDVNAKSEECTTPIDLAISLKEEGNVNTLLQDDFQNPSLEWQETFCTISNDKIKVWTNNNFELEDPLLTYLRYPIKMDISGYKHVDGSNSIDVDPELPDDMVELIIDASCKIIAGDIESMNQYQINKDSFETNN